jgi:hypothetical protein
MISDLPHAIDAPALPQSDEVADLSVVFSSENFMPVMDDLFCDSSATPHDQFKPSLKDFCEAEMTLTALFIHFLPRNYTDNSMLPSMNAVLLSRDQPILTIDEFALWLGYWIAMSLHTVNNRRQFWSQKRNFLSPLLNFGQYDISRNRFEMILNCLSIRPATPEQLAVDPMLNSRAPQTGFNAHMRDCFKPGWIFCIDESMSRWTSRWASRYFLREAVSRAGRKR